MKLPSEDLEKAQLRQLTISLLKMINGLVAFTYIALGVWLIAQIVHMITG